MTRFDRMSSLGRVIAFQRGDFCRGDRCAPRVRRWIESQGDQIQNQTLGE
jgi:hypothetical protein